MEILRPMKTLTLPPPSGQLEGKGVFLEIKDLRTDKRFLGKIFSDSLNKLDIAKLFEEAGLQN